MDDGGCKLRRLVFFFFLFYNLRELGGSGCAFRTYGALACQQACLATYARVHTVLPCPMVGIETRLCGLPYSSFIHNVVWRTSARHQGCVLLIVKSEV